MSKTIRLPALQPPLVRWRWQIAGTVATCITAALVALVAPLPRAAQTRLSATLALPTTRPTVSLTAQAPTTAVQPAGLPRAVVAYAAPDGDVLGAIEAGRPYRLQARAGADWFQLDVAGSGVVWVRAAEWAPQLATLPDLATSVSAPELAALPEPAPGAAPAAPPDNPAGDEGDAAALSPATPALSPATPALSPAATTESRVIIAPTVAPCTLREIGTVLRPCNGVVAR